jgi:hypothetical protein
MLQPEEPLRPNHRVATRLIRFSFRLLFNNNQHARLSYRHGPPSRHRKACLGGCEECRDPGRSADFVVVTRPKDSQPKPSPAERLARLKQVVKHLGDMWPVLSGTNSWGALLARDAQQRLKKLPDKRGLCDLFALRHGLQQRLHFRSHSCSDERRRSHDRGVLNKSSREPNLHFVPNRAQTSQGFLLF